MRIKYISYHKKYAGGVAKLWNESVENWPEGLGSKLEKSAKDIEKEISLGCYLKIILALSEDGEVAGYCDLKPSPIIKGVCYLDTLNVHPKYQGLGIGRSLLKRIINFSINAGYNRIDAFTWPSNIKAISLYKKMGFFWQPNTSVQMLNFIPMLFNRGFVKHDLLKKWDALLQVKTTVGPDKFQSNERLYYQYLFKNEQILLEIRIDKLSQCVFHYKTTSIFFTISAPGLISPGDEHRVEIKTTGFRINNAKFYCGEREFEIDIAQNVITIPSKIQMLSKESVLKIFAQSGLKNFEFGVGFYKREKIQPLDENKFIHSRIPQIGFRNLAEHKTPLTCKVTVEKTMRKAISYQICGTNELFTIDISNILKSLPSVVHKVKFTFKEKSKKIATIERFLLIGNKQNMFYTKLGTDIVIWLKNCCCVIKNPGAKLVIHSHNLIDRGLIFANYDQISDNKEEIGTEKFSFRCSNKNDKIIIRAISEELSKIYIFTNPGNIMVKYKFSKPLTILSNAYLMDESALLKIGAKKIPITMIKEKGEELIKQSNGFRLLTHSLLISYLLNKNCTKEIDFVSNRITYKIDSQPMRTIFPVSWQIKKRRKKLIPPPNKIQKLVENVKVEGLLMNKFICVMECLSLAVDPSFGLGIYSLKFNNKEILLTSYPKVEQLGEDWPWYGGLYTLGCLANREIIDSFKELCLEEKTEMYSIISYHNGRDIPGIFVRTSMNNVSDLKKVYLHTYYFLLPYELIIISKFENETRVPMPFYFSSMTYINPSTDLLLISDAFQDKIMLNKEHLEIPGERIIEFRSQINKYTIRYFLYSNLDSKLKVINLADKKGFNLVLDVKDYFKPTDFVVQHIRFKER